MTSEPDYTQRSWLPVQSIRVKKFKNLHSSVINCVEQDKTDAKETYTFDQVQGE